MIKVRLHGTPEEIKRFAEFLDGAACVRVLSRSEPYPDRGKSMYWRAYMDVELLSPPPTVEIVVEDSGNCPYKGTTCGKEVCILTLQPTKGAVQCDFEYENCVYFQHCEKYKKREAEADE